MEKEYDAPAIYEQLKEFENIHPNFSILIA
jgi:hypothetical protein